MACAVIDADGLPYKVAYIAQTNDLNLPQTYNLMDKVIHKLLSDVNAHRYICILSGPNNFRYKVKSNYKATRVDQRKKTRVGYFDELNKYLIDKYEAKVCYGAEADDAVCIIAGKIDNSIIISNDKDLLQVPGLHYNYSTSEFTRVTMPGEIWKERGKIKSTGDYHLWKQVLQGDSVDNIKGVPGIGPKTAYKLLSGREREELPGVVLRAYINHYGRQEGPERFREVFEMVYIIRDNEHINVPTPVLRIVKQY